MRCRDAHRIADQLEVGGTVTGYVSVQGLGGVPTHVQVTAVASPGEEGGDAPVIACSVYEVEQRGFRVAVRNMGDAPASDVRLYWNCEH